MCASSVRETFELVGLANIIIDCIATAFRRNESCLEGGETISFTNEYDNQCNSSTNEPFSPGRNKT